MTIGLLSGLPHRLNERSTRNPPPPSVDPPHLHLGDSVTFVPLPCLSAEVNCISPWANNFSLLLFCPFAGIRAEKVLCCALHRSQVNNRTHLLPPITQFFNYQTLADGNNFTTLIPLRSPPGSFSSQLVKRCHQSA